MAARPQALAQAEQDQWTSPVNLSHSDAASSPIILAQPHGSLRAFWWDRFDGLTLAERSGPPATTWTEPRAVPILVPEAPGPGASPTVELIPIEAMPRLVSDSSGTVHAFWLDEPELGSLIRPLLHARLAPDDTRWSTPEPLAPSAVGFDVAAGVTGTLHLAYVTAVEEPGVVAGVYYRRSDDSGQSWGRAVPIDRARYLRLLDPETVYVRLAADSTGGLFVTWDDPHLDRSLLAFSSDKGASWQAPQLVGDSERGSRRSLIVPVAGSKTLLIWEATAAKACNLYQAPTDEVLAGLAENVTAAQRVLREMTTCPTDVRFLPLGNRHVVMVAGGGSDTLTLAAWDGERWSETRQLRFSFPDAELGSEVSLTALQMGLAGPPANGSSGSAGQAVVIAGVDQTGDVWTTGSRVSALELAFAPPPPWSAAVNLTEGHGQPDLPAVAVDDAGQLHVLWSEAASAAGTGTGLLYMSQVHSTGPRVEGEDAPAPVTVHWMAARTVLQSPEGRADEPAMAATGDRLHVVWSGGPTGEVVYSTSFAPDAYKASAWSEPVPLPSTEGLGSWPDIAVDAQGTLQVVYAVPINEGRGIYYTRSDDGGETWSAAGLVFDAADAGWAMVDYPRLAIDGQGTVHIIWVRSTPAMGGSAQGIYYARSVDHGETWSQPLQMADGAYGWPDVAVTTENQVHVLWNEVTGTQGWWQQWSADGGVTWTQPERVGGFGGVPGPAALLADGGGGLHLAGLGEDEEGSPALLYSVWDGSGWSELEISRLALDSVLPGVSGALIPSQQLMAAIFRGERKGQAEEPEIDLWHTERTVSLVAVTPVPTYTARPTAAPSPTKTVTPTPSPTQAVVSTTPPSAGSAGTSTPLLIAGGLAALLVVAAFGGRFLRSARR